MSADLLRKYKHMESMIQFYDQSLNNITKYWTYGCWCFQMGDFPLRLGNGSPVDGVDKHCKKQKECYRCAKKKIIWNLMVKLAFQMKPNTSSKLNMTKL